MKSHSGEQVNLLGSCFPVKGMSYERNVVLPYNISFSQFFQSISFSQLNEVDDEDNIDDGTKYVVIQPASIQRLHIFFPMVI